MIETLGTVGAFLLAWCGLPQLVETLRTGHCAGISWGFLLAWFFGEVFVFAYVLDTNPDWRLLLNYGANAAIIAVLIWFRWRPRNTRAKSR